MPPTDLRHGAVVFTAELAGVAMGVLEEDVPVNIIGLLSDSTAGVIYGEGTAENSEHLCHLPGGASKGVSAGIVDGESIEAESTRIKLWPPEGNSIPVDPTLPSPEVAGVGNIMLQSLLTQLVLINDDDDEIRRVSVQAFGRRQGGVAESTGTSAVFGSSSSGDRACHLTLPAPFPRALLALRLFFATCGMPQRDAV